MDRPENEANEKSHLAPLRESDVGHDLERLACTSDLILFAHPSLYHEETARELAEFLPGVGPRVPLVLSPSRTLAAPYLWRLLGEDYPLVSFQTCPYACKCYRPGSVWIKRRKHALIASAEGEVEPRTLSQLASLFPHIVFSRTPAVTSLGNIGAVFHPAAYLLNLPAIRAAKRAGRAFSFYQEGIARNRDVGPIVEEVDQIRLRIADALGCQVFGLRESPREQEWSRLMRRVEESDVSPRGNLEAHHRRRAAMLRPIHDAVVSGQHWLDYTYGVKRIAGESLAGAIGRTPNFMTGSVPQARYAHEDVATGLVPFEALAQRLGIDCQPITGVIDLYAQEYGVDVRETGRNLADFDLEYLGSYLRGEVECLALAS